MITYTKKSKTMHIGTAQGQKYVACIKRDSDTSLDTIAEEISVATSLSYPDVLAALKAFEIFVGNHIMNGSAVKFGTLGAFIPKISSKAEATEDDVTDDSIKRVSCRFFPSVSFKNKMKTCKLRLYTAN